MFEESRGRVAVVLFSTATSEHRLWGGTMSGMRSTAILFVALLFVAVPSSLFGAEDPKPKPITGSNDKCLDEKIAVVDGRLVLAQGRTDTERYRVCRTISGGCNLKRDQAKECTCGRMIYVTLEKKTLLLNKCDPDMQKKLAKALGGGADAMAAFAAQAQISERIRDVDTSTQSGREQLSQILQSYGVSQTDADAKVNDAEKAAEVQAQLQKFVSTSDTGEAKRVADELGFKLNKDLTDEVRLDPRKYAAVLTEEELDRAQLAVPTTFREVVKGVVADALAPLCGQLGGCSDVACQYNPGTLTCRTNNPGAITWAPWEAKYGGQPCGQNNNTTCFPNLESGLAAKIDLLTSSRYLGGDNNTILRLLCNGYAPNAAGNNCAAYATFVQNQTGIPMNQTIDPKNPEQVGKIVMAMARMENGKFVPFTPQQLENAMAMVYGGKLPNGTPGFIPQIAYGTNGGTQFGSPFSTNYSASPAVVGYGSAFGGAAPAPVAQSSYSQPTATPASQNLTQNVVNTQNQGTSTQSEVAKQLQEALQNPDAKTVVALSPANIVIQQKEVTRGNPISVSWTSVGMSTDIPCVLRANSTRIADGNQGSRVVPTTQATRVGSLIFTLACTTSSGVTFQRTAAVMVR